MVTVTGSTSGSPNPGTAAAAAAGRKSSDARARSSCSAVWRGRWRGGSEAPSTHVSLKQVEVGEAVVADCSVVACVAACGEEPLACGL